jgi:endogenous inhibitor of DNA gyrase (YacG/DUF329 family)
MRVIGRGRRQGGAPLNLGRHHDMSVMSEPAVRSRACPICGKPSLERLRPFCSRRCADVDLNRWLSGVYAVPAPEQDSEAEQPPRPEPE